MFYYPLAHSNSNLPLFNSPSTTIGFQKNSQPPHLFLTSRLFGTLVSLRRKSFSLEVVQVGFR